MVEHLLQVAVRGLSQTVSNSQGWSLHKAILLRSVIKLFKLGRLRIKFHKSFGSLFWLLGVPIGSLFHKKWVPISAWGSLLVLETVLLPGPKERKSFLAAFVNGILFIQ